ncbi:MAG: hypothetical protein ABIW32_07305 [Terrimesophilobacter sp.]
MTDDQQWQAPGSATPYSPASAASPPPPPPIMGAGPQAQPGYYAAAPVDPAAAWAPPPKVGLVPLRPMSFGTILGASFKVLRRNPRPTFGAALLVQAASLVISLVFVGAITALSVSRLSSVSSTSDSDAMLAGTVAISIVAFMLTAFLSLMALAFLQGIIVIEVARGTIGEKLSLRRLWQFAKGRIWALIGWSMIVGGVSIVVIAIAVGIIVVLAMLGSVGQAFAILFGIFATMGLTVLAVWLYTKLSLVPSALMLERVSIRTAVSRSWSLSRGDFWKIFGVQVLVGLILNMASYVIIIPFLIIMSIFVSIVGVNGNTSGASDVIVLAMPIAQTVLSVIIGTITSIVMTATTSLLYLDMRMRKEGLDLELTRFVEAGHLNADESANPYLRAAPPNQGQPTGYTFS